MCCRKMKPSEKPSVCLYEAAQTVLLSSCFTSVSVWMKTQAVDEDAHHIKVPCGLGSERHQDHVEKEAIQGTGCSVWPRGDESKRQSEGRMEERGLGSAKW